MIYGIAALLILLSLTYAAYMRTKWKSEVTLRLNAEAQRDALQRSQEALRAQQVINKKEIKDAVTKAKAHDYSSLGTLD